MVGNRAFRGPLLLVNNPIEKLFASLQSSAIPSGGGPVKGLPRMNGGPERDCNELRLERQRGKRGSTGSVYRV
jgi:hypothetical protein